MQKIINDLAIKYSKEGSGPTILMLHGWGDNLNTFNKISKQLEKNYEVIRLDFPGFGKSQVLENDWYLNDYINFTQQFIEKLNIDVDILLGHSFGGRVIIKGVSENILQANKIVLISSAGIKKSDTLKNKIIKGITKTGKLMTYIPPFYFFRKKIKKKFYDQIQSDYLNAEDMKVTFINIIEEDLQSNAKKIEKPTLLIWGEKDDVTPVNDGQKIHKLIKNSKLEIIKNSSHFVHQEKPEEVIKLINNFNA